MVRAPQLTVDPARDAAALLRRIGFVALMIGLPVAGFASRTGAVLVLAVAVPVIAAAALVDDDRRPIGSNLGILRGSPAFLALLVGAGWAAISTAWAPPAPAPTGSGALGTVGIAGLGLVGFLALPDRMRSANLYPIPIGAALAALVGLSISFGWLGETEAESARRLERGFAILVTYAWPALAWLRSRSRDVEAIGLALLVAGASALAPTTALVFCFAAGALAYLVTQLSARVGTLLVGAALAALIVAAPVLLWLLAGTGGTGASEWLSGLAAWRDELFRSPARLLTGHGVGSLRSDPGAAALPTVFGAPLAAGWYELGLVGMTAAAVAVFAALRAAGPRFGPLLPGLAGGVATAFAVALTGIDGGALWWPAALAAVAILFVAAERGQFRTRRPRALGLGRTADRPATP